MTWLNLRENNLHIEKNVRTHKDNLRQISKKYKAKNGWPVAIFVGFTYYLGNIAWLLNQ